MTGGSFRSPGITMIAMSEKNGSPVLNFYLINYFKIREVLLCEYLGHPQGGKYEYTLL